MQIPPEFTPVTTALPPNDKPVLAIRESAYISVRLEVLTARYMPDYRPLSPWRDIGNDAITDSGETILGWMAKPDWLNP